MLGYVAEHLRASVRELEGALHSLIAHAVLTGKRLDLALAKTALRDTIRHTAQAVALRDVERAVCQLFEIDAEALKSDSRARALTYPRMLAMYLARKHTGAAYSEIGRYFGGRNHSTVISAEKKVSAGSATRAQDPPARRLRDRRRRPRRARTDARDVDRHARPVVFLETEALDCPGRSPPFNPPCQATDTRCSLRMSTVGSSSRGGDRQTLLDEKFDVLFHAPSSLV